MGERVAVLGIGNPLMRDEGVGVRVIEEIMRDFDFGEDVVVMDAGTMGMTMLGLLCDSDYVLVVDALNGTGHPAGTVLRLSAEDLADNQVMHSLHDMRFSDVLDAARLMGACPEGEVVGVQVEAIEQMVPGLTPAVEGSVPYAVDAVLRVLAERGVVPSPRTDVSADAAVLEDMRGAGPETRDS